MKIAKKVFKGLELNEKDNFLTATAKGGFEDLIDGMVIIPLVWTGVYLVGKYQQKNSEEGEAQ